MAFSDGDESIVIRGESRHERRVRCMPPHTLSVPSPLAATGTRQNSAPSPSDFKLKFTRKLRRYVPTRDRNTSLYSSTTTTGPGMS